MRSKASLAIVLFLLAVPLSAQTFVFDLRGSQEVPPVPSTASGGCMGQLDQPASTFTLTCVHNVVGATVLILIALAHQSVRSSRAARLPLPTAAPALTKEDA